MDYIWQLWEYWDGYLFVGGMCLIVGHTIGYVRAIRRVTKHLEKIGLE